MGALIACGSFAAGDPGVSDSARESGADANQDDVRAPDEAGPEGSSEPCPTHDCRFVFVTSTLVSGAMGDVLQADAKCQLAANRGVAALQGRTFKAWLSSGGLPASARLKAGTKKYILPNGTEIAASPAKLSSPLEHAIDVTELNAGALARGDVWTGTSNDGATVGRNCSDWGMAIGMGDVGALESATSWSFNTSKSCLTAMARLYCFED